MVDVLVTFPADFVFEVKQRMYSVCYTDEYAACERAMPIEGVRYYDIYAHRVSSGWFDDDFESAADASLARWAVFESMVAVPSDGDDAANLAGHIRLALGPGGITTVEVKK